MEQLSRVPKDAPFRGLPIAVKDNFCTRGVRTTAGSRMLEDFVPIYDAAVVERLRMAGAVITGKTNMDEFGMGSTGMTSFFGATKSVVASETFTGDPCSGTSPNPNPIPNPKISPSNEHLESDYYVPGGSSSGSAVAVAIDSCFAAVGSDTGGSVRLPAAFCGLVGLKPSYGRVSRWGLIAYASSLDCPGILSRSVDDAAVVLDILAGPDTRDPTCIQDDYLPVSAELEAGGSRLEGMRVGVPVEFFVEELPESVVRSWREAARVLEEQGAVVEEVSVPAVRHALATYYVLAASEASSNLARYDGVQYGYRAAVAAADKGLSLAKQYTATRSEGFGEEVQRRIMMGSYVLSDGAYEACYEKAVMLRKLLTAQFDQAFTKVDALISPVSPFPVPLASQVNSGTNTEIDSYVIDCMTVPASLAGIPAIAVPFGPPSPHVPESIQVMAPFRNELTALRVAKALEGK